MIEEQLPTVDESIMPSFGMDGAAADPTAAVAAPPVDYENVENLAEQLPAEFLKLVGEHVVKYSDMDYEGAGDYRKVVARHMRLWAGELPEDWTGEKNVLYVHMPYLTKAILLFHSKLHRNFFPATGDICGVKVSRPSGLDLERRVSRHLNLTLQKRVPEYVPAHDRGGMQVLLKGSAFSVWYHDPIEERPAFEFCSTDDIRVPYKHKSDRVDMADVPRITWRKPKYRHELQRLKRAKYYINVEKLYTKPLGPDGAPVTDATSEAKDSGSASVQKVADQIMGVKGYDSEDAFKPRFILEHDTWLALPIPGQEDIERPVTVHVDEETKAVLRLSYRERPDPKDHARFKREEAEHAAQVESATAMHADTTAQIQQQYDQQMEEFNAAVAQGMTPEMPQLPDMPLAPQPPTPPKAAKKIPWNRYTHYGCIPNPEGFYHFGLGKLIEGHNITANEVMSLYVSLMRMNLRPTGWYSKNIKAPRGEFEMELGKMKESHLQPGQLDKAIFTFQFPPPDANAFKVEERQAQAVQEITADDIVGGGQGLSGQTATETEVRSGNAMDNINMIAARYNRSRTNEIQVLAFILSETLPDDGDSFFIEKKLPKGPLDQDQPQAEFDELIVHREDYQEQFDVHFTADPNLSSQYQREQSSMKLFAIAERLVAAKTADGTPALDPPTAIKLIRGLGSEVFRAHERPDFADLLDMAAMPMPEEEAPMGMQEEGDPNAAGTDGGGAQTMDAEQGGGAPEGVPEGLS